MRFIVKNERKNPFFVKNHLDSKKIGTDFRLGLSVRIKLGHFSLVQHNH